MVNEKNELLVIQEKYHPLTASARWKLPGGHAGLGNEASIFISQNLSISTVRHRGVCVGGGKTREISPAHCISKMEDAMKTMLAYM